jgi:uncharacterized protein YbcV (DUF1398 family)
MAAALMARVAAPVALAKRRARCSLNASCARQSSFQYFIARSASAGMFRGLMRITGNLAYVPEEQLILKT